MPIPLLSPADRCHWGLFRQPFTEPPDVEVPVHRDEYIYPTAEHQKANLWVTTQLRNHVSLAVVHAAPGAGITTWTRRWKATQGIERMPLEVLASTEAGFDRQRLQNWLDVSRQNQHQGIRTLAIVDGTSKSSLLKWYEQTVSRDPRHAPMTMLVVRSFIVPGHGHMPTHRFETSTRAMAKCLLDNFRHAGQPKSCVTDDAAEQLAEWSQGNYHRLGLLTHLALIWGAREKVPRLDLKSLLRFRGNVVASEEWLTQKRESARANARASVHSAAA
ncbi:hypothetical protein [Rhodopirellula halodulae]|uniref:hypothetical protein n=1 Tax=Rhodopirellula halodulae TaxID=2894198 RepID=UPI001E528023|nr:hypothetical protein [Rhodopirellula sp. JC737]MCC9654406.1 hypothetical protein [Rhodopirellula sp. JC737]